MTIGLLIILLLIFVLPFLLRVIEHNLEYFLFVMGISAVIISGQLSFNLIGEILSNQFLYLITGTVLVVGLIFRLLSKKIRKFVGHVTNRIPLSVFIFLLIVILGLISSAITAIIAALVLVEIVHALPLSHKEKVKLTVIVCFSIGLGAALTPVGEPLSTLVVSTLNVDFFYLMRSIGVYIIPSIFALGLFGAFFIERRSKSEKAEVKSEENKMLKIEDVNIAQMETLKSVIIRAFKIFVFIFALELLGTGFRPLIDQYIISLDGRILYWLNMSSAILDNATLVSAEMSPAMNLQQVQAILMGVLLSGGMLIPGNIPNIISAGKLNIKSRDWAKVGAPIGFVLLVIFFVIIFVI